MKELRHRVGALELAVQQHAEADTKAHDDVEGRLRSLERLTAKVVGGAIVGSTVGAWILSQLGSCVK
jgi:hypothetical protein